MLLVVSLHAEHSRARLAPASQSLTALIIGLQVAGKKEKAAALLELYAALRRYAGCREKPGSAAVQQLVLGKLFVPMVAALAGIGLQPNIQHDMQPVIIRTCDDELDIEVEEFKYSGESHALHAGV